MKPGKPIKIISSGIYLPRQVSSLEIEWKYNLKAGWAERYSGVLSRHHVTFESNGYMGARALENALKEGNMRLGDLDLLISAGATFDYPLPGQASILKSELKEGMDVDVGTLDIDTTCLSFVSAFEIAAKLLDGKQYKHIAIVSSEIASKGLHSKNPETLTLFGDGAAAFILAHDKSDRSGFIGSGMKTYSQGAYDTIIKGGGNQYFFRDHPYDELLHSFQMNGKRLLKLARQKGAEFINGLLHELSVSLSEIEVVVPHQSSKTGLSLLKNLIPFKPGQLKENIQTHGNCIAASIPLLLHDTIVKGELKRGDTCFLIGTSAGFSIGGVVFKY